MSDLITIKGGRNGVRVRLDPHAEWAEVHEQLRVQLERNGSFFAGATATIELGERSLEQAELEALKTMMQEHGLALAELDASERTTRTAARTLGINARPLPRYEGPPAAAPESEAIVITRTVRSGQVVRHSGHITLIGDVNPGAEVIAGGSVVVWGRLRGFVHAGALGNRDVVICALEFRPTQLRIADQIARTPEGGPSSGPEIARLDNEQIVVEDWETHRKLL